jgi:alcohol dehydrogenase
VKAVQIDAYGDTGVLRMVADAPKPEAAPGQVLIEVHAASINPADSMLRAGYMQSMVKLQFPATMGSDVAGVVVAAGSDAVSLKVGDRVYGSAGFVSGGSGAFAEYAAATAGRVARLPAGQTFVQAAALPLAGVSALQAIEEQLQLRAGSRILIHGGAGGIGSLAIQIAKRAGAYVASTCHGGVASFVRNLGADEVIDVDQQAFQDRLKGFDAVLDTIGAETYTNSFSVLKKGGVLLTMIAQPNAELAQKFGVRTLGQLTDVNAARLDRLAELVAEGAVKIQVDRVFALSQAKEAFLARESGPVRGKIVLQVRKEG